MGKYNDSWCKAIEGIIKIPAFKKPTLGLGNLMDDLFKEKEKIDSHNNGLNKMIDEFLKECSEVVKRFKDCDKEMDTCLKDKELCDDKDIKKALENAQKWIDTHLRILEQMPKAKFKD